MNEPDATVYTETVVHAAPIQFAADAPYQLAIIDHAGTRTTVRIEGHPVKIGDRVRFVEERNGTRYYTATEPRL